MLNTLLHNKYVLILFGGGLGSLLRYLVQGWGQRITAGAFPVGTLIVNVVGCFAIGLLASAPFARPEHRTGLVIGLLGGFTTFSAFSLDTAVLWERGDFLGAVLYVVGSVILSILALFLALWLGRSVLA